MSCSRAEWQSDPPCSPEALRRPSRQRLRSRGRWRSFRACHAIDDAGRETLDGAAGAKVLRAIRGLCPETPISLTPSATSVADPAGCLRIVEAWEELPDVISANQGELGIVELCELLLSRGVGIEVGLLRIDDARAFGHSGFSRPLSPSAY